MGEDGVVDGLVDDLGGFADAGGFVDVARIRIHREAADFVKRDPVFHAGTEGFDNGVGVVREGLRRGAVAPAAGGFEVLRGVPVKHGDPRRDAVFFHGIEEPVVEVEAGLVDLAVGVRNDAGPGEGEAVVFDAELGHEGEVGVEAVVMVAGDVEVFAVVDAAGLAREVIPDGLGFAVGEGGSLDLGGGGGDAPGEVFREGEEGVFHKEKSEAGNRCGFAAYRGSCDGSAVEGGLGGVASG